MKCPVCRNTKGIEIDMHADGYARNVLECSSCHAVWSSTFGEDSLIYRMAA